MNKRILNDVFKKLRFDPNNDTLVGLLKDVTNDGYYLNRAIQLLREAEYFNANEIGSVGYDQAEGRIDECIKLLIIRKAVNHAVNTGANSKSRTRSKGRAQQVERKP